MFFCGGKFLTKKINARELALKVLLQVEEKGAYANLELHSILNRLRPGKLDRAFASELVYGIMRSLNTLDWVIGQFLTQPLEKQTPAVRNILRMGVYQIMYMDRVPDAAACNESANLARQYGHSGAVKFVNGVLRNIARKKNNIHIPVPHAHDREGIIKYIGLKYSHPQWMVRRWLDMFSEAETIELCQANNCPAPVTVRTNTLKISREELIKKLSAAGLDVSPTPFAPEGIIIKKAFDLGSLAPFKEGLMQVQDESSMLVGHALSPRPGARVLDVASAPGGKATHLAQLMGNQGEIAACDLYPHKLKLIRDNYTRLGISIIKTRALDARSLSEHYHSWADYVLLDAPCSGLGVLRRRVDARWRKNEEQIKKITVLQNEMLAEAARCLLPGGIMVYSTCTITPEENTGLINDFLRANQDLELRSLAGFLPPELGDLSPGYIQLLPHKHFTDGFFIARMQKKRKKKSPCRTFLYKG